MNTALYLDIRRCPLCSEIHATEDLREVITASDFVRESYDWSEEEQKFKTEKWRLQNEINLICESCVEKLSP